MTTLEVPGVANARPAPSLLARGLPDGAVRVRHAVSVQAARAGTPPVRLEGLADDDVLELEFRDGFRLWMRVGDVPRDLSRDAGTGESGVVRLPATLAIGPSSRDGAGAWAIKALAVVGIDVEGDIVGFVSRHVEGRLDPAPGLYRCSDDLARPLVPVRRLGGTAPVLVFLHGTASSTLSSFGDLWQGGRPARMSTLLAQYGGRVLAFQHRTLTESPLENAADLLDRLARVVDLDAEVHLVSHSRGGLVGEVLARGMCEGAAPFTPDEVALFDGEGRARDRRALGRLNEVLPAAKLRITRFVRVACPARGTTLADARLDRYVSVLVNLASMVPGLGANPVYDGLTSLLAGVLRKRTDPAELPGLEAMMPASPLVRVLNRPGVRTRADLHVIGGDVAPSGVWGRLKTLATDFYYRDDHDLVVNTAAMLGGIERVGPVRYWIDTGGDVTHFSYFRRDDTASRLVAALGGVSAGFRTLETQPSTVTSADYVKRAAISQPVAVVVPGIMGSQLSAGGRSVWIDIPALAGGGLASLDMSAGNVRATGLVRSAYGALCRHLSRSHHVVEFPYDWRQPLDVIAAALRARLEGLLDPADAAQQPVRLVAHSMGGLVVRAMLASREGRDTWARLCRQPGARLLMLGTPNGGAHAVAAMLMGRDPLVKGLALLDLAHDHRALLATIAGFEGVLDLLPGPDPDGHGLDWFDAGTWQRLLQQDAPDSRGLGSGAAASDRSAGFRWRVPDADALGRARALARAVRTAPLDPARVVYVAGVADETACGVEIDDAAPAGRRVRVKATARGDGRVTWDSGIPAGVRSYFANVPHGDLASDARILPALEDLLTTGHTSRLPDTPPARRAAADVFDRREPLPTMVPDAEDLAAAALGGRPQPPLETGTSEVPGLVRVIHDNLTNARHPVLVGHYQDDVIVAAEAYLDRRLRGRLSELLRMELYPGPIGSAVVVANEAVPGDLSAHPGAIVAGLGTVGELTPGTLTATLAQALTTYGADCVGRERRRRQREGREDDAGGTVSAPVSALLVGSGDAGLSLNDALHALLRALVLANRRLRQGQSAAAPGEPVRPLVARIDRLDILELYEDRAIAAAHALRGLARASEFDGLRVEQLLVAGREGQRRSWYSNDQSWWQRLRVTSDEDRTLRFEAVTNAARARGALRPTQRRLVEGFVEQALGTTQADRDLGCTLFELLVPNDFKPYAPDRRKLAILLDAKSAALPWELLQDRFDAAAEPLSVAGGLVRQLLAVAPDARVLRSPRPTALVIGNPPVADRRFPPLPGASEEARTVAALLEGGGYEVASLVDDDAQARAVFTELHRQPWRVLHAAAHGVFEFTPDGADEPVSGLVLDDGLFLTPAEAAQLRVVPDLVFINCCHLGRTEAEDRRRRFPHLAANLATHFIGAGARAVVAAGWAVDDAAATTFATSFYREMLGGALFGDAVCRARQDTYRQHGATNTWGAYQCYGDPSFSLHAPVAGAGPSTAVVAEAELACALENLAAGARQHEGSQAGLVAKLDELVAQAPSSWWPSAGLCASAGRAYAEVGLFGRALDFFDRLPGTAPAAFPVSALEQAANCRVRLAATLIEGPAADRRRAAGLLEDADREIQRLLAIGRTPERLSLAASLLKQRVRMRLDDPAGRREDLRAVAEVYGEAYACAQGASDRAYALSNRLAADIVLDWEDGGTTTGGRPGIRRGLRDLEALAAELGAAQTDVFSLSARADVRLLGALARRRLTPANVSEIANALRQALSRGATRRQRESMQRTLAFLRALAEVAAPAARRDELVEGLRGLEQAART